MKNSGRSIKFISDSWVSDQVSHVSAIAPRTLSPSEFILSLEHLAKTDADLGAILKRLGKPPMWTRPPGFPTLVYIILEQQVSLASARSAFERLKGAIDPITPSNFLSLDDPTLKSIGFSRQKSRYCQDIAEIILEGRLDLSSLSRMNDEEVRATLLTIRGVGAWTAEIYLLMALNRPDAWPGGDLALARAIQQIKCLPKLPTKEELEKISQPWMPWRAVAARLLWHHYLNPG